MAADVAGYSRLMGEDEEATIAALVRARAVFHESVESHSGRIVDTAGDSVLSIFESVIEAVRCALAVQDILAANNSDMPTDRQMHFRIGVHFGDIVERDDGTIYGDGVNIAARLESLAEPGGLIVSGTVHEHVVGKLGIALADLGEQEVKNIARPVRAWRVATNGASRKTLGGRRWVVLTSAATVILVIALAMGAWWWMQGRGPVANTPPDTVSQLLSKPAVVVLPFANASGEADQDAFADSLTRNLVGTLSNIYGLAVVSSAVSLTYKDNLAPLRQMAEELGVQSVLVGSVQNSGGQFRVNAELVHAATGRVFWSDRYKLSDTDQLAVQDEIVKNVVTALQVELVDGEAMRTFSSTTDNPEAHEYASRVRRHYLAFTRSDNAEGIRLATKALELDPEYSRVWVALGWFHHQRAHEGWSADYEADVSAARAAVERAIELDPLLPASYTMAGQIALRFDRDFDRAVALSTKGVELNINNAQGWWALGRSLTASGMPGDVLRAFRQIQRLAPYAPPAMLFDMGQAYLLTGQVNEARGIFRYVLENSDDDRTPAQALLGLALIDAKNGREEDARGAVASAMERDPRMSARYLRADWVMRDEDVLERWLRTLRGLGLPK